MKLMKRILLSILSLALLLGLSACASGPDMPMEAVIDGYTVVLGQTTMADLTALGYEVNSAGRQDVARDGDKYIYFHYSLSKGAGYQFWVTVYTPYYGGTNINKEASEAAQTGIVDGVTLSKSAAEKMTVTYNGMDLQDISFDTASEWGAKQDKDASKVTWDLTASQGALTFEAKSTSDQDMNSLRVAMNIKAFEAMQKDK